MGKLVFVADDYDHVAIIMADILRLKTSWETVGMKDGAEVLALARSRRPDACVLDIDMPLIDGVRAARKLRLLFPGQCPLLIAMSGVVPLAGIAQLGVFDQVVAKPLDMELVIRLLGAD